MYPDLNRRRLLGLGMTSLAILPRAGAGQPDFNEGYVTGDGARLFHVWAGEGSLMLFLFFETCAVPTTSEIKTAIRRRR